MLPELSVAVELFSGLSDQRGSQPGSLEPPTLLLPSAFTSASQRGGVMCVKVLSHEVCQDPRPHPWLRPEAQGKTRSHFLSLKNSKLQKGVESLVLRTEAGKTRSR